jgi:hypothetical protein
MASKKLAGEVSEKQLMEAIRHYAKLRGYLTYHTYDSRRSDPGFPDLICVRGEAAWALELKTEKGRVTEDQKAWIDALNDVEEVRALIVRPSQLDEIINLMR